ncbi:MAG: hypothetical protein ACYDG4_09980 [Desulfuromonadaceae bacterium]
MKRNITGLLAVLAMMPSPAPASEQSQKDESRLEEITVTAEKITTPTRQTSETVYTGSEVTRKGIELQGSKAQTSVYEAVDLLPGMNIESVDSRGLGAEQRNVRARGVRGSLGTMTIEGVPNYGGNPIGPREYLCDMENMNWGSV